MNADGSRHVWPVEGFIDVIVEVGP
jgi:hypothetical protein